MTAPVAPAARPGAPVPAARPGAPVRGRRWGLAVAARRLRRGLPVLLLGAAVLGGAALAGCTSVRNVLGTADSECYVAIPPATQAVHGRGHLLGVRLLAVSSLRAGEQRLYRAARLAPGSPVNRVCLVAFTGHFSAASVDRPIGRPAGRLAVVELAYPGDRVVATLVVAHPPLPFGHSHIGFP